jgi:hypothetical protein
VHKLREYPIDSHFDCLKRLYPIFSTRRNVTIHPAILTHVVVWSEASRDFHVNLEWPYNPFRVIVRPRNFFVCHKAQNFCTVIIHPFEQITILWFGNPASFLAIPSTFKNFPSGFEMVPNDWKWIIQNGARIYIPYVDCFGCGGYLTYCYWHKNCKDMSCLFLLCQFDMPKNSIMLI